MEGRAAAAAEVRLEGMANVRRAFMCISEAGMSAAEARSSWTAVDCLGAEDSDDWSAAGEGDVILLLLWVVVQ